MTCPLLTVPPHTGRCARASSTSVPNAESILSTRFHWWPFPLALLIPMIQPILNAVNAPRHHQNQLSGPLTPAYLRLLIKSWPSTSLLDRVF